MDKKVIIVDSDDNSSPESRYLDTYHRRDYCDYCIYYDSWLGYDYCFRYDRLIRHPWSWDPCEIR